VVGKLEKPLTTESQTTRRLHRNPNPVFKIGKGGLLLVDYCYMTGGFIQNDMRLLHSLLSKLGLSKVHAGRNPIRVFLLDDDKRRHRWFAARFKGDFVDVADNVKKAQELLAANSYDAIFLDHDLHPEHYNTDSRDDERTGYAIASWLAAHPELHPASTIMVHTRNADGAMRMVEELRRAGRSADYVPFPLLEERIKRYW
jgi:hypothetical protein